MRACVEMSVHFALDYCNSLFFSPPIFSCPDEACAAAPISRYALHLAVVTTLTVSCTEGQEEGSYAPPPPLYPSTSRLPPAPFVDPQISPFTIPALLGNTAAGVIAIETGAKGPNFGIVSACATATHCLGEALQAIREGEVCTD